MADYFNESYTTGLDDFCKSKELKPSELEIITIVAIGSSGAFGGMGKAHKEAMQKYDKLASEYMAVVDLQEGVVTRNNSGIMQLVIGFTDEKYIIRGTGVNKK